MKHVDGHHILICIQFMHLV